MGWILFFAGLIAVAWMCDRMEKAKKDGGNPAGELAKAGGNLIGIIFVVVIVACQWAFALGSLYIGFLILRGMFRALFGS